MCFSVEADLVGGAVVGAIGVDALRHCHRRRDLALAALPALFAAHFITEAFVWWGLGGQVPWSSGRVAMWLYLAFAFWVLPLLVPLSVMTVEPDERRQRLMRFCVVLGAFAALSYVAGMLRGPVTAEIDGRHIAYSFPLDHRDVVDALYVFVAVVPWLASSHKRLVAFGAANAFAVVALFWLTSTGRISLWCAWAAVTSLVIALHLRHSSRGAETPAGATYAGAAHAGELAAPDALRQGWHRLRS